MPQVCQVQGISLLGSRALLQRSRRAPRAASPSRGDGDDRRSQFCRPTLQKGWRPPTSSIGSAVFFSCDPKKYGFDTALRVTARSSWLAVKTIGHQGSGARACSAWLPCTTTLRIETPFHAMRSQPRPRSRTPRNAWGSSGISQRLPTTEQGPATFIKPCDGAARTSSL